MSAENTAITERGWGRKENIWEESKEWELTELGLKMFLLNLGSLRSRHWGEDLGGWCLDDVGQAVGGDRCSGCSQGAGSTMGTTA